MGTAKGATTVKDTELWEGGWRRSSWPTGLLLGNFLLAEQVLSETEAILRSFRGADGPHEGIAFWGGLESGETTLFTTAVAPRAEHTAGSVRCDEVAMREVIRALRGYGLGLLAQVHSHPGSDARHSYGDDEMIFMPFEGMLSIVVPEYAREGISPLTSCEVHQFQGGKWVLCEGDLDALRVLPSGVDLR